MGPLGYAWIWKWLTICIYYQTLTLLNHPFGGPMIHIHLYIHPTSHPNHSLEHIRRWVPWRMTCHLCASWGLGCCFYAFLCLTLTWELLSPNFGTPWSLGATSWDGTTTETPQPGPGSPNSSPPAASTPWSASCDSACQGLDLGRCGNSYEFGWHGHKKKRSASDGSPAGHRSSLTRTPEKCTCERRNTVQTNIPYYRWSWSPINYIGSISLSHSKSLY